MIAQSGAPVIVLSTTPESISGKSASFRGVAVLSLPGALLFISSRILSISSFKPEGRPSITTPIAFPWLSPNTEIFILSPIVDDIYITSQLFEIPKKVGVTLVDSLAVGDSDIISCNNRCYCTCHYDSVVVTAFGFSSV